MCVAQVGGGPFSTKLSAQQLGWWQALVLFRTVFACVAWVLGCLLDSTVPFAVPPLPRDAALGAAVGASRGW